MSTPKHQTCATGLDMSISGGRIGEDYLWSSSREAPRLRVEGFAIGARTEVSLKQPRSGLVPGLVPRSGPVGSGPEAEVLAELRERVQAVEAEHEVERQRTGRRVLGRRAVLQQSWRGYPSSVEPRRNLRPQVASRNK
ncbi:MAG TPA: hypothetical protein VK607_01585, partial [Kofleriaceae bacterium]|nr:hypothetical protein [Kofleriaceae bacterium]